MADTRTEETDHTEEEDDRSVLVTIKGSYQEDGLGGEDYATFVVSVRYVDTPDGEEPSIEVKDDAVPDSLRAELYEAAAGLASLFVDDESEG